MFFMAISDAAIWTNSGENDGVFCPKEIHPTGSEPGLVSRHLYHWQSFGSSIGG
jgi:hypothetical protein